MEAPAILVDAEPIPNVEETVVLVEQMVIEERVEVVVEAKVEAEEASNEVEKPEQKEEERKEDRDTNLEGEGNA